MTINKNIQKSLKPSFFDDLSIKLIRRGKSTEDKNFLMDNPLFSPEAMEKRSKQASLAIKRKSKKEMLAKFGK